MNWIPNFFRRDKIHEDLLEEMRLHVEERIEQLQALPPALRLTRRCHRRVTAGSPVASARHADTSLWH